MTNFYERWLARTIEAQQELARTPVVARGRDLSWVETPQDARVAVMIGAANGFPTMGTNVLKAEIPVGWHTGKRVAGEEAIHILSGTGFSVIGGRRYNWKPSTTLHVPFMADQQHFNTGDEPAWYVSANSTDLDLFVKLGRVEQLEEKGKNPDNLDGRYGQEESQLAPDGRRIALHLEDAIDVNARREAGHGHRGEGRHSTNNLAHRHGGIWTLMGGSEVGTEETNGFVAKAASITDIFEETAHTRSHSHTHTEAVLYVLEGHGYSEIDFKRYDWVAGDAVHVPPKMTRHEHFNDSDARTRTLRIEFGVRYYYEELWEGFRKVEHRLTAETLQPA